MTDSNQNMQASDEITLKELILLIQEYWGVLWAKKWYILAAGLIGGLIFGVIEYRKPVTYTAELTFMVNEDEGSSLGALGGLAASFGFGGGGSSEYNLEKIKELSKSRKILQPVLFDSLVIDGQNDLIANHIIRLYNYHDIWKHSKAINEFLFSSTDSENFTTIEKSALKDLLFKLVGTSKTLGILQLNFEESTGILKINSTTLSEDLSIALSESTYTYLSRFYIKQSTEKQQFTLDILKEKADSTEQALYKAEYDLAKLMDNSQGFRLRTTQLKEQQLNRDIQIMTLAYGEILKNKATAEFLLESARPFFQVIDRPISPIQKSSSQLIMKAFIGFIVLAFLTTAILIFQLILSNNLKS